jgi:hypothetical protein
VNTINIQDFWDRAIPAGQSYQTFSQELDELTQINLKYYYLKKN